MALDPYAALGVDPAASAGQITAAYRRLVRALHPDTTGSDRPAVQERFTEVVAAYRLLRDPQHRAAYDSRARRAQRPRHCSPPGLPPVAGPPLVVGPPAAAPLRPAALRVGPVRVAPLGGPARRA